MTKKKNILMGRAKETIGLGVASGAGLGVMGALGNVPGAPTAHMGAVTGAVGSGLTLLNVGQMARNAGAITDIMGVKQKKGKTGNKYIDKII